MLGDARIGKSRLVLEFLAGLTEDTTKLVGRCAAQGQGVTLRPVAEILKAEAAVLDSDPAELAITKIQRLVTTLDPALVAEPSRTTRALAATLGLVATEGPGSPLSPSDTYRELVGAWLTLFGSYGRRGPVVVVIEDLHWADPMLLDVLDELAERLEGPILFVGTSRPDLLRERPDWGGGRRGFSSLPLEPLAPADTARLVSLLLGDDALTGPVRRRVLERSEGNPFFLEEIVRHLIDDGVLERQGETWRARSGIDDVVAMPDNVHGVILARLDLLSAEERRAAQRAAVVGRTFWDGAVATLADIDDLEACLRTLRRREFVVERLSSSIAGQREFAFKHVLIRDVAYESLPRRLRGQMHVQTAAWIERTSGEGTVERENCSRATTTPPSPISTTTTCAGVRVRISSPPPVRRRPGSPSGRATGSPSGRSTSLTAAPSGSRPSKPSETSTTWRFTATRRGGRTDRRSRSWTARILPIRGWPGRRPSTAFDGWERSNTFRRSTRHVTSSTPVCGPHPRRGLTARSC